MDVRIMVKTLTKHGNSLALIIERPILELLNIKADTPLEISTDGEGLHIRPAKSEDHKTLVREATGRMMDAHDQTLKKLAE
jgi:antitoxin MazE